MMLLSREELDAIEHEVHQGLGGTEYCRSVLRRLLDHIEESGRQEATRVDVDDKAIDGAKTKTIIWVHKSFLDGRRGRIEAWTDQCPNGLRSEAWFKNLIPFGQEAHRNIDAPR